MKKIISQSALLRHMAAYWREGDETSFLWGIVLLMCEGAALAFCLGSIGCIVNLFIYGFNWSLLTLFVISSVFGAGIAMTTIERRRDFVRGCQASTEGE